MQYSHPLWTRRALTALCAWVAPSLLQAQPLRLAAALAEADARAFANKQAAASVAEARARTALPLRAMLPTARLDAGVLHTTDPIGAFGTTLRQRAVTAAAFDPARLNDPAAVRNVQAGLVVDVPLLNVDAIAGRRAAQAAAQATTAAAAWTTVTTQAMVIRAWFGAALAREQVGALEEALRASNSGVKQVDAMVRAGLVTRADALQAAVREGDIGAALLGARHAATTAVQQLAVLLGRSDVAPIDVPTTLPTDSMLLRVVGDTAPRHAVAPSVAERADVQAATLARVAAARDYTRARGSLLPRVNGFARFDWNAPSALFAGKPNWTVGVMGSWSLFSDPSARAEATMASARAQAAGVGADAAAANARLDVLTATRALTVALEQLALADLTERQAREAARLVSKRYQGGLATVAERLGADAASTAAALVHAAARYAVIDALVERHRAIGADLHALTTLDVPVDSTGAAR